METPRYEVIADYPKSPFTVNQILILEEHNGTFVFSWYEDWGKDWITKSELEDYPHIFKKL